MIIPVYHTKDKKLFRVVLRAVVRNQPFRNAVLIEHSIEMVDDSARADVSQFS